MSLPWTALWSTAILAVFAPWQSAATARVSTTSRRIRSHTLTTYPHEFRARERILDGLPAAKVEGRRGGRPRTVDDDALAIARCRRSRGESVTATARHLSVGRSTLYRALN